MLCVHASTADQTPPLSALTIPHSAVPVASSSTTTSVTTSAAASTVGEPFGTLLGVFEKVEVRSCLLPPGKTAIEMECATFQGICTGIKWQCVELARRYLVIHHGILFDCIPTAHNMFTAAVFRQVATGTPVPAASIPHGSTTRPQKGSLLVWKAIGRYAPTGHVAIVVDATDTHVDVIEQNFFHTKWPQDRQYSRRIVAQVLDDGGYIIAKHFDEEELHGWITLC
ncbi:hypothetical protein AeMF1_002477 [Aphanomyces euteiches]|nr:hypothetical protein AeMF1_002477 [Aphanomyces euteiches]KAH9192673.1 hypothetical protein AeNC1_005349 [Aphanomyces euteiches]